MPDPPQLAHATRLDRVLVTKDHDFIELSRTQTDHAGIILLHKPLSIGEMIDYLELMAYMLTPAEMRGLLLFRDW